MAPGKLFLGSKSAGFIHNFSYMFSAPLPSIPGVTVQCGRGSSRGGARATLPLSSEGLDLTLHAVGCKRLVSSASAVVRGFEMGKYVLRESDDRIEGCGFFSRSAAVSQSFIFFFL